VKNNEQVTAKNEKENIMTFVYEQLDSASVDALRKMIPAFQSVLGFSPSQAIDHERKIIYVSLGGKGELPPHAGEPPNFHALFWNELCVAFEGYETLEIQGEFVRLNVAITKLRLPVELKDESPAIQDAIQAAMTAYRTATKKRPVSVSVKFPKAITY